MVPTLDGRAARRTFGLQIAKPTRRSRSPHRQHQEDAALERLLLAVEQRIAAAWRRRREDQ